MRSVRIVRRVLGSFSGCLVPCTTLAATVLSTSACSRAAVPVVLTADMPLHLEDHLDAATFTEMAATDLPKTNLAKPVEWRFDEPQPDWKASPMWNPSYRPAVLTQTRDSLRVTLTPQTRFPDGRPAAGIHVDVPDWDPTDWAEVVIRLRAKPATAAVGMMLGFNVRGGPGTTTRPLEPFEFQSEGTRVGPDGAIQTHRLRVSSGQSQAMPGPWRQLGFWFYQWPGPWARTADSVELLSVTVVPRGAVPEPTTVEWRFDQPQPDWKPVRRRPAANAAVREDAIERPSGALRVLLPETSRQDDKLLHGGVYVDLSGWRREEWAHIIVRARTTSVTDMTVGLNPRPGVPPSATQATFARAGGSSPIVSDGSVQTYEIRPDWGGGQTGPWMRVGFDFRASVPGSIDILSVSVVPVDALYAGDRAGFRSIAIAGTYRRTVFAHAPGRLLYRVRVPEGGRLQAALGILNAPVEFRVTAQPPGGGPTTIFQKTHTNPERWADQSVDLSSLAGQTITLGLEAHASAGAVAFWGSPTLSGAQAVKKPNVILYVIDGGGADSMSVYGYTRRTTPNLERLAAEGAVFDRAYSNSTATRFSTPSFMTSLQSRVLGRPLPDTATTMAERFHTAGYQTGVFTSNPWAASGTQLGKGVDTLEDAIAGCHGPSCGSPVGLRPDSASSRVLNEVFWHWRESYTAQPYWVHIQTTDVHAPYTPVPPFAGLFVSPDQRHTLENWNERLGRNKLGGGINSHSPAFQAAGVDRTAYFTAMQGIYDEMMALNDYQIGRLVDRLKATGEWQNTLLIVTADHGSGPAMDADTGLATLGELPPRWTLGTPMFRPSLSHVPLLVVWPGHITGGQRFDNPVSLIDLLPTVLDLVGFPRPDVMQGQSLAPLLRGRSGWTARPVILDESERSEATGEWQGQLEVVDGRWGASMWIGPPEPERRRPWPVLLFDLWNDPICVAPVNETHPDLVKKYTKFLEETWVDHQLLARKFKPGAKTTLTPEQLERLRALGYIR